jgi:RNA polymerase sigma-70 factor (ECF subfamily)
MSGETMDRRERLLRSLEESGVFLVDELGGRLERLACSRGLDGAACEEVVQEAFAAIFRQRSAGVTHPEAWLVRVVACRCRDWHRRRASREQALAVLAARGQEACGPPSNEILDLARALAQLPARLQEVVRLRYVEGLRTEEAADRLGYSPASYRSTLSRTMQTLRSRLDFEAEETSLPVSGG